MADEDFQQNILRMIAAELWFIAGLQASQATFGKSYTSLSVVEKGVVDQLVNGALGGNYNQITPAWLAGQKAATTVGFAVPASAQPAAPGKPAGPPKAEGEAS